MIRKIVLRSSQNIDQLITIQREDIDEIQTLKNIEYAEWSY